MSSFNGYVWLDELDRHNLRPLWQRCLIIAAGACVSVMIAAMAFSMTGHTFDTLYSLLQQGSWTSLALPLSLTAALLLGLAFFALYVFAPLAWMKTALRRDARQYRLHCQLRAFMHQPAFQQVLHTEARGRAPSTPDLHKHAPAPFMDAKTASGQPQADCVDTADVHWHVAQQSFRGHTAKRILWNRMQRLALGEQVFGSTASMPEHEVEEQICLAFGTKRCHMHDLGFSTKLPSSYHNSLYHLAYESECSARDEEAYIARAKVRRSLKRDSAKLLGLCYSIVTFAREQESIAKTLYPGCPEAQRAYVREALDEQQRVDDAMHPQTFTRWLLPMAEGLGWANGLAANAITVLYGGVMGLSIYTLFLSLGAMHAAGMGTILCAALFYGAGATAALLLTKQKIKRITRRLATAIDQWRLGMRPSLGRRQLLAIIAGLMTTAGMSCFAFYSGLHLLNGHGIGGGLLGLMGHAHWLQGMIWPHVMVATVDASLTFIAAGCLYVSFNMDLWGRSSMQQTIKRPWYKRFRATQVVGLGLAAIQTFIVACRMVSIIPHLYLAIPLASLIAVPLLLTYTATFSQSLAACWRLLPVASQTMAPWHQPLVPQHETSSCDPNLSSPSKHLL